MTTYLSTEELDELKKLCSVPMLELGMARRPKYLKCFEPNILMKSVVVSIHFPCHESASTWNDFHEKRIRFSGHMVTAALTTLVGLIDSPTWSVVTGSATAISKDEAQAGICYPKVYNGWSLTRTYHFQYRQFPMRYFAARWVDVIRDEKNREKERKDHGIFSIKVGEPDGIPEKIVKDIMTRYPQYKSVQFNPVETGQMNQA